MSLDQQIQLDKSLQGFHMEERPWLLDDELPDDFDSWIVDKDIETTNDKCPNKCGQLLVKWTEANGPDDYRIVYWCSQCEERFDE